ncbi:MAG TPA: GTP-binding protein [Propionibacteriaceae bacterium]
MTSAVPVLVVASIDLIARQSFVSGLLLDLPDAVVVTHDLDGNLDAGLDAGVRRVVIDRAGVRYDDRRPLGHVCLSCAVREDLVPTLRQLVGDGRWRQVVLALPVAADPVTVVTLLQDEISHGGSGPAELAGTVSLVDPATLVEDLFGDDLLVERGVALGAADRRSVGEVLARQIESSDLVATSRPAYGTPALLLQHLTRSFTPPPSWNHVDGNELMRRRLDPRTFRSRVDPLHLRSGAARTDRGVWTLDLTSRRALHPSRLQERIEDLGRGAFRARGYFWLPTRPDALCVWDGGGGQLSIGRAGSWRPQRPSTRLIVTGIRPADRARVADTFSDVLLTGAESAAAASWVGRSDGFEPWLDEQSTAA